MKNLYIFLVALFLINSAIAQWTLQNPLPQGHTLHSVHFSDDNTGYAVGDVGTIIKTLDGGTTWTVLTSGTTDRFNSAYFPDVNTGYVVGDSGTIVKTIDGGIT